ncbi:AFG1-like ATPase-domain-containing protein [Fimicolochytrium jonesii]|uniref:AFG1-like ATPase-domain-containing protein n=1 Tax=Fimicolochytrium jonesii TaxID=1396493 RepID=UPI0022FEF04D|nr:AFG1-like ATPase-domain-containing protein [Fimicolochytrium jonesii]KAI8816865.1 AFG1-like ATPase-domain-containing protein [Fimicolochytrium jonesii]
MLRSGVTSIPGAARGLSGRSLARRTHPCCRQRTFVSCGLPTATRIRSGTLRTSTSISSPTHKLSTIVGQHNSTATINASATTSSPSTAASAGAAPPSQGPLATYTDLLERGLLRPDAHQRKTVELLENLYLRVKAYDPPPVQHIDLEADKALPAHKQHGRDDIMSPDFAWAVKQEEETFLSKVFGLFGGKKEKGVADVVEQRGPRGLYLFGDVGTGKSMTMDLFYNTVDIPRKRRVHFHAFMQDVHRRIHKLRTQKGITYDPIPILAAELVNDAWLLCFDELQVTDITDAMILRRLFDELFKRGMVMVTTSNRPPDDLYKNGIQRSSFLPAIDLLKQCLQIHSLNSGIDYRKQDMERLRVYFTPLNSTTAAHIDAIFTKLADGNPIAPRTLTVLGRPVVVPFASPNGVAKISFAEICGQPHSAADYLELVTTFHTILITDIPRMSMAHRNEARRFITLIDAMYENKTRLVVSAETDVAELFSGEEGGVPAKGNGVASVAPKPKVDMLLMDDLKLSTEHLTSPIFTGAEEIFAFQRAVSRLREMQSLQWLGTGLKDTLRDATNEAVRRADVGVLVSEGNRRARVEDTVGSVRAEVGR